MNETFNIDQLAMMTGFTTRSLRNFIKDGFLQGDKSSGAWRFTEDQIKAFVDHPSISPTITSKKTSSVIEFINSKPKDCNRACVILDVKEKDAAAATEFFMSRLSSFEVEGESFTFSSDRIGKDSRYILRGSEKDVFAIIMEYMERG